MKAICKICYHYELCKEDERCLPEYLNCNFFKNKLDVVEVVRCKDCKHSRELEKNCEINNREHYRHCAMYRGDEERVWVKYKRYYKDYSIVEIDDYCSYGERKCDNG